jgi:hypothetical protein
MAKKEKEKKDNGKKDRVHRLKGNEPLSHE